MQRNLLTAIGILTIIFLSVLLLREYTTPSTSLDNFYKVVNKSNSDVKTIFYFLDSYNEGRAYFKKESINLLAGDEDVTSNPAYEGIIDHHVFAELLSENDDVIQVIKLKGYSKRDHLEVQDNPLRIVHIKEQF